MISWFILVVVQTPSEKNHPFDFGISFKRPRSQPKKLGNFHISKKNLEILKGDFFCLEFFRTPIPLTMKDLIVGTKTNKKLKLVGSMTFLMLIISDGLWT